MDQTTHFRAVIKAVRTRRTHEQQNDAVSPGHGILPKSKNKSNFSKRARDVTTVISKLREFLLENRREYVNVIGSTMTDKVREQIDQDAIQLIRTCQQRIQTLQQEANASRSSVSAQVAEHQQCVTDGLTSYLKAVCEVHSEQRAVRVRQLVEKQRLSRLETNSGDLPSASLSSSLSSSKTDSSLRDRLSRFSQHWTGQPVEDSSSRAASPAGLVIPSTIQDDQEQEEEDEDVLSESERMAFEQENIRLPQEMDDLKDEVKQIEGSVLEISKLQGIFSENVLNQAKIIEEVADNVAESSENIQSGNENIREAIKNNASWRVWVIFFLLMCSVCLLFLDWYSG